VLGVIQTKKSLEFIVGDGYVKSVGKNGENFTSHRVKISDSIVKGFGAKTDYGINLWKT